MMGDAQQQQVGSESTAIQAQGNVTNMAVTNNYGLSATEVKELCLQVFLDNFPVLRQEAITAARNNVQEFAASLEAKIIEKSKEIDLSHFADPDVQAAINDAVQANARKGEKANPSVLVDLITERVSFSTSEYKNIVISEAVTVVPKLTKEQIAYLSFIHYMTNTTLERLSHVSGLERWSRDVLSVVSAGFDLSHSQKRHIEYAGACSILSMMRVDIYKGWMDQKYKYLKYIDLEKFKNDLAAYSPSSKILLDAFDKESEDGEVTLTSVGQAIAIANLSRKLGKIDYSIWLK